ncbi:hypothetical protein J6590_085556 [Homalodisca vitripennis]|nr:hypothetical protein J6590_085556 [Homalodisca vitripennis]
MELNIQGVVLPDRLTATLCRVGRSGIGISPGFHIESWRVVDKHLDNTRYIIIMKLNIQGVVLPDRLTATLCRVGRNGIGISPGFHIESRRVVD